MSDPTSTSPGIESPETPVPISLGGASGAWSQPPRHDLASSLMSMQRQMAEMENQMERMTEYFFQKPANSEQQRPMSAWMEDDFFGGPRHSMLPRRRLPGSMLRDAHARWFSEDPGFSHDLPAALPRNPSQGRMSLQTDQFPSEKQLVCPINTPGSSLANIFKDSSSLSSDPDFFGPVIVNDGGKRKIQLRFDVHQYKPEEIEVKTLGSRVTVHALHKEETDHNRVYCEFQRVYTLPDGVDAHSLESSFSREGILTIDAPLPSAIPEEPLNTAIKIIHEKK
nr:small heat shock protein [Bonellia viridis]